jgi:hypothetical protein
MTIDPNFTPTINPLLTSAHYNVSQMVANQPLQMTTPIPWITFSIFGMLLLVYSVKHHEDMEGDLCGVLAWIFLLVSAWQSFMVDTVTNIGVAGVATTGSPSTIFMAMESHQIYHYDLWGYVFGLVFLLSCANLFLLWLRYTRITNQKIDTVDRRDLSKRVGAEENKDQKNETK